MRLLCLLITMYMVTATRMLNKTMFYSYLMEYTIALNQTDILIDERCPFGGLYRDNFCTRTFSPACKNNTGILINRRCRKRSAPLWTALDDIDICTLAGAGPSAYFNPNILNAASRNKSFLYCIDFIYPIMPSPNLAYALYVPNTQNAAIIGGSIGGVLMIVILCGILIGIRRIRQRPSRPNSIARPIEEIKVVKPIITANRNPIRINELEYARHQFAPIHTRRSNMSNPLHVYPQRRYEK